MSRRVVWAYVSGHGFGHWTRSAPVLEVLARDAEVHVRTSERAWIMARRAAWAASVAQVDVGPGVIQRGPIQVDHAATRAAVVAHVAGWPAQVEAEVEAARAAGVTGIYADVPPVGLEVAGRLGVPSVALANFTWSWIYEPLLEEGEAAFAAAVEALRAAEGRATEGVGLLGGGGLERIGARPRWALRRPVTRGRAEARRLLPVPESDPRPRVLISFGGFGDGLDLSGAVGSHPEYAFVAFAPPAGAAPDNLWVLPHDHGLPHQDLVLGADVVLAKPGYGTVSECLEGPTPMLYVEPDGGFREHWELVRWLERCLPHAALSRADLAAGRWSAGLEAALGARAAEPSPPNALEDVLARVREVLFTRRGGRPGGRRRGR